MTSPHQEGRSAAGHEPEVPDHGAEARTARRAFLLASLGVMLGGCATGSRTGIDTEGGPDLGQGPGPSPAGRPTIDRSSRPPVARRSPIEPPSPTPLPGPGPGVPAGVMPRSQWAGGELVPTRADRMTALRRITIHHDGMNAFYGTDRATVSRRIEQIRLGHRQKGWADIGYHFVVDRAGRVWEARPLAWQGAHVGGLNEGNIGIVNLGNYEEQTPSREQLEGLWRFMRVMQQQYRIPSSMVRSHCEMAATLCPGRNMQQVFTSMRASGAFGRA